MRRSASADGSTFSCSSLARMNASISLRGHDLFCTFGGVTRRTGWNDQCFNRGSSLGFEVAVVGHFAPASIHFFNMATSASRKPRALGRHDRVAFAAYIFDEQRVTGMARADDNALFAALKSIGFKIEPQLTFLFRCAVTLVTTIGQNLVSRRNDIGRLRRQRISGRTIQIRIENDGKPRSTHQK